MYTTMLLNKSFKNDQDASNYTYLIFWVSLVVIGAFSIFFINYAHTAFIKSRYKEFGIYMSLGMTTKDIKKIILIENLVIIAASLIFGILAGTVFSRLFQMVVLSLLDIENYKFSLNILCYVITLSFFALIFVSVLLISGRIVSKLEINELMKKSRENEKDIKNTTKSTVVGLIMFLLAFAGILYISNNKELVTKSQIYVPLIIFMFFSAYIIIKNLGMTILFLLKKNTKIYYKNVLTITEIARKFNQNKKVIFLLTILSAMIVFLVASPFALYNLSEKISDVGQPYAVEFCSAYGVNKISNETIDELVKEQNDLVSKTERIEFIAATVPQYDATDVLSAKPVISQSTYNKYIKNKINVETGTVYNAVTFWMPGDYGVKVGNKIKLSGVNGSVEFKIENSIRTNWISCGMTFPSNSGIIISDEDYALLKSKMSAEQIGTYYMFDFKNFHKSEDFINKLTKELDKVNDNLPSDKQPYIKSMIIQSKLNTMNTNRRGYSMFMFVTTVMGLLFFISAGCVLLFRLFSEMDDNKQKFNKLFKLGITHKQARSVITKELAITFFSPLIFGTILGYILIYFMTHLVGGEYVMKPFFEFATVITIVYFVFQSFFFLVARKKVNKEVIRN